MKKNKLITYLLSFVLILGLLSGCSSSENEQKKDTEITGKNDQASFVKEDGSYDLDAAFAAETGKGDPIRVISTFEGTCQVQSQIAYLLGFYEAEGLKEGVDYVYVESGGETGAVLLSTNQADVAIGLISGMLQPLDNGLEAKAISGLHTGCITIVTLEGSGINNAKDLK